MVQRAWSDYVSPEASSRQFLKVCLRPFQRPPIRITSFRSSPMGSSLMAAHIELLACTSIPARLRRLAPPSFKASPPPVLLNLQRASSLELSGLLLQMARNRFRLDM